MPECRTLGTPAKAVTFIYHGSVNDGIEIEYEGASVSVSAEFFQNILNHFAGMRVAGGFKVNAPTPNGFGEWVRDNSHLNTQSLTPKHASRIAAILVFEEYIVSELEGIAVYLNFNA